MKVLIEGGGIAGLTLASFLEKQGIDCVIVEKSETFHHLGFGIAIWDMGLKILKKLNVDEKLREKAIL